jgi:Peptidase A4 family
MRTAGRWLGAVAAAVAIAVGAAACGGAAGTAGALSSFGHMAGYVWTGRVTAVTASWSVPRITSTGAAHASTWIGAQAPGVPHPPFIQVGTLEDRGPDNIPAYSAFWTDTRRGFRPEVLFTVHAGDTVSTALSLTASRWRVSIEDRTGGQTSTLTTSEDAAGDFNLAEWLQENPTEISGKITPYPDLSTVSMTRMTVNGAQPRYGDVFAQWMSLPGRDQAPTPLRDGAFTIIHGLVTPAARRYLAIASAQNLSVRRLDLEAARFTARTPARDLERVSAEAASVERRNADALARGSWPAAARGPIRALVRQVRIEAGIFAAAADHPPTLAAWRLQLVQLTPALQARSHPVRRALRLPEPLAGQSSTPTSKPAG